jgi:uncharacterized metal-binding protein
MQMSIWLGNVDDVGALDDAAVRQQVVDALETAQTAREEDAVSAKIREVTASVNKDAAGEWPRVKELVEFATRMGVKRIGLAFCVGLANEAAVLRDILASHGLEVCGVACSVEGPCNSTGQAKILNALDVDLNVLLGLCVGHDAVFMRHADAPATVVGVKDKVTCHNPVAALTCPYQQKKLFKA